jgi:hypothetical protein
MKNYEEIEENSVNFFVVMKGRKKVENEEEKNEISCKMSPIILETLCKILDGSYSVEEQSLTLNINGMITEYSFTVK